MDNITFLVPGILGVIFFASLLKIENDKTKQGLAIGVLVGVATGLFAWILFEDINIVLIVIFFSGIVASLVQILGYKFWAAKLDDHERLESETTDIEVDTEKEYRYLGQGTLVGSWSVLLAIQIVNLSIYFFGKLRL